MLDKLERKLGKYALPHLMNYLIGGYAIGYVLYYMQLFSNWSIIELMTLEPYYIIHQFQFWRIITWVLIPPQENLIFALIMMFFYWQLGRVLEQTWGTFRFNVYIFGGILLTVISFAVSFGLGFFLDLNMYVKGGIELIVFGIIFLGSSILFKMDAYEYFKTILPLVMKKFKGNRSEKKNKSL